MCMQLYTESLEGALQRQKAFRDGSHRRTAAPDGQNARRRHKDRGNFIARKAEMMLSRFRV